MQWFCQCGQCYPRDQNSHMAAPVTVARQQTTPELSGTFRTLPPEPTPTRARILRNTPEPSKPCLRNPPEPSRTFRNQPFGTFRNLPPEPTPAYTGTLNLLEPAYAGTFRNLLEPASGTYTSTYQNSPEPSSGTCSCDPHRHTPELIWAENPISLRCWGKNKIFIYIFFYIHPHFLQYVTLYFRNENTSDDPHRDIVLLHHMCPIWWHFLW